MQNTKTLALLVAASSILAACASAPKAPPVFSESFITNITPQGNHLFTYTANVTRENHSEGRSSNRGGGRGKGGAGGRHGGGKEGGMRGAGGGGSMPSKMRENPEKAAQERLDIVLADTGYCPNGWFVIEQVATQGEVEIRGECRAR